MIKFENKTNGRFYYLIVQKDFFNDMVLTIIRGGRGTRFQRHFGYQCETSISAEISRLSKIRLKRGYELVT